ncbi:helix-turn-helix domain-containing protein [Klenkia brasiliensis]|uniref:Transcriptional regulator, contains XRE-family HTH domain n=1 Tax=Klenkia brasiliensis TaxID=333142 RepID=A0A1G7MIU3_9ACTN|nr:helix-turn-helix transcriptional regulator [Klenkia brasiliensis]SDF61526.1 Transcriptional regulator, contains XRE-family HTH domain [Klenkia brasiliensis]
MSEAAQGHPPADFDLSGTVRRIRRTARLSQRELALAAGLSKSTIAQVETGRRGLSADALASLATIAGLRLALVDGDGVEVLPMRGSAARDDGGRRYPAHCDVRHGDEGWWYLPHRAARPVPWFTFDLRRSEPLADDDHPVQVPEDDPRWRAEQRRVESLTAWAARQQQLREDYLRRLGAGEVPPLRDDPCTCPPGCEELLVGDDPAGQADPHVPDCPCRCDVH